MPMATESFYGRDAELREIQTALDPSKPGRKSLLIYGMGGSGKTQLTLRHIGQEGNRYSAVIWINGSTKEHAQRSFAEAAGYITSSWPRDLPTPYAGSDDLLLVSARLRSTLLTTWLLVIDSADNPEQGQLSSFIPTCPHGSVLITSTRLLRLNSFKPDRPMSMHGLDPQSSQDLLVEMSGRDEDDNDDRMIAREIGKELSGMPLAVEQAGALIRDGEFSFADFLAAYKTEYTRLMENFTPSDESRVFTTILDMTYRSVEKNPQHLALLNLIGVLGPWQIPLNLLEGFSFTGTDSSDRLSDDIKALQSLLGHPNFLRAALRRLATLCVITLREEAGSVVGVMIHRVMCQWCLKKVTEAGKQDLILQAAYGLARGIRCPSSVINALECARNDQTIERKLAAPLSYCLALLHLRVPRDDLDLSRGRLRDAYATIITQAAWVYLRIGPVEKSKGYFLAAVEYDTLRNHELGRQWPADETSLVLLWGLASAYHRSGDLKEAEETFGSAVELSKSLHGDEGEETRAISTRYIHVSKRKGVMSRHHQSAVVASASAKRAPFNLPGEDNQDSTEYGWRSASGGRVHPAARLEERGAASLEPYEADLTDFKEKLSNLNLAEQNLLWNLCTVYDPTSESTQVRSSLAKIVDVRYDILTNVEMLLLGGADIESKDIDRPHFESFTLLADAIMTGNEPLVQFLLDKGADLEANATSSRAPLVLAVETEHEGMVHLLIKNGVDKDVVTEYGSTALTTACARQSDTLVRMLLDHGANPNVEADGDETALTVACNKGSDAMVQMLLDHGANPNNRLNDGYTALMAACVEGSDTVVQILLNHGAKPNMKANDGFTALMAACNKGSDAMVQMLLDHGANPNNRLNDGYTALMVACVEGSDTVVQILLNHGAKPNMKANDGFTALMAACVEGSDTVVQILLNHGAKPNMKANDGFTALMVACVEGSDTVVQILLNHGAKPNMKADDGLTALMVACVEGSDTVVQILLNHGAKPNNRLDDGLTALMDMAVTEQQTKIRTLQYGGADVNVADDDGETALMMAARSGRAEAVELLLNNGAKAEAVNNDGETALMVATRHGHTKVVKMLLPKCEGANAETFNDESEQALIVAVRASDREAVETLLRNGADIEATTEDGNTAFDLASDEMYEFMERVLLGVGGSQESSS
ncbi:Ankyrin repeat domain-containing protein 50 [Colletotrichum tabaci]|uniref:Ankyrin repeat domain-containing protein 50 n=1 Tax=Colletotrichum tabaci TaxID=1209068 RepID=A0AAV9T4J0_9PEZI